MTHAVEPREVVRTEVIECITDQWNFPYPRNQPWVNDDGTCSICGQPVDHARLSQPDPNHYTAIAAPHTRTRTWHAITDDELQTLTARAEWA